MTFLASDYLFKIGSFEVTVGILVAAILILVLIVAIIAYRFNHRKQAKAAMLMDNECLIYNKKGLEKYLQRKHKKFSNPTLVVAEIET